MGPQYCNVMCGSQLVWKVRHRTISRPSTIGNVLELPPPASKVVEDLSSETQRALKRVVETIECDDDDLVVVECESDFSLLPIVGHMMFLGQKTLMTSLDASFALFLIVFPSPKVLQFIEQGQNLFAAVGGVEGSVEGSSRVLQGSQLKVVRSQTMPMSRLEVIPLKTPMLSLATKVLQFMDVGRDLFVGIEVGPGHVLPWQNSLS